VRFNENIQYAFFDESMMEKALHEQRVISDFKNNLKSGQFVIYLQPQVDKSGNIGGAECLVRWLLPDGKVIPPFEFIEILEQSNLIGALDEYVWELAAKQLSKWKGTPFEDFYLSVNVSPKDFYYLDVANIFPELCKKYDVDPSKLHVEITETAVADEMHDNMATLGKLQDAGFTVEIDDFGKGSSSLGLLKDLKADVLKIDMRFIQKSENDKRSNVILESVIDMAKRLNMEVISEGIETKDQLQNLEELGCDVFQGFYFSKPIPVASFEQLAQEKKI
jgi:EAL domain-containing protein (putative c-di-GMP-specific phosphodiesterase class I)